MRLADMVATKKMSEEDIRMRLRELYALVDAAASEVEEYNKKKNAQQSDPLNTRPPGT